MPRPSFPKGLREFQRQFSDEESCRQFLTACRWPDGFRCPRCGHERAFALERQVRQQCAKCAYQASLTAGTVLHNTKTPLVSWFWGAYLMVTDKRGLSALLFQRQLGIRRYETAWLMLHKLRRAMVNTSREPLRGAVEIDETWVGGPQPGLRGSRQLKGRKAALVVVAVERHGDGSGRIRMEVIDDFKEPTMTAFAKRSVVSGSTIYTDGMTGYSGLRKAGYVHVAEKQQKIRLGGKPVVPLVDRAVGNMKQWLIGTHHGVGRDHLQLYLDEFVFRHNRRGYPWAAFRTLLGLGSARGPTGYDEIIGAKDQAAARARTPPVVVT